MGQAAFDTRGPALATRLIEKFAGPLGTAVLTRTVQGTYDELDGSQGANTETESTIDVSPLYPVTLRQVTDTVLMGDFVTYIAGSEYTFTKTDLSNVTMTYNSGQKFRLVWVKPIYSGANIAAYETFWRNI